MLSSAVRFSVHEYYAGKTREASEKYARESWLSVLADHLTVEDSLNVHVVQTVNLLAVVDYTGKILVVPVWLFNLIRAIVNNLSRSIQPVELAQGG